MLLRIVDSSSAENNKAIRIFLEYEEKSIDFYVEGYSSPMTQRFYKDLSWYFNEYIEFDHRMPEAASLASRLIKNGQFQGDALLGEDHQLLRCKDYIQTKGFQHLTVTIESNNQAFFHEMWEALVLPDTKYILSGVAKSYVRRWTAQDIAEYPDISLKLRHLFDRHNPAEKHIRPFKLLHLVARPKLPGMDESPSNSLDMAMSALCGDVIDYAVAAPENVSQLKALLANSSVQLVHYDGPVIAINDMPHIVLADADKMSHLLDVRELSVWLAENKIGVLCIDARVYLKSGDVIPAAEGLANLAYVAHQHGIGNIIGLGQVTNPWVSAVCYKALYEQIAKGHRLDQAVVEARKALQAYTETDLTSIDSIPFMFWPLLVHYSRQSVEFFIAPRTQIGYGDLQRLTAFKTKLFGFRSSLLAPFTEHIGDCHSLSILNRISLSRPTRSGVCVSILGEAGLGKSALVHAMTVYLSEREQIDHAFYFSYADDFYTLTDICIMIAPVLGLSTDSTSALETKLSEVRCLFVFDDFIVPRWDSDEYLLLEAFILRLLAIGQLVFVIGNSSFAKRIASCDIITLTPLTPIEQTILCVKLMRELKADYGIDQISPVLKTLNGNPWLIKKVLPLLTRDNIDTLAVDVVSHISNHDEDESKLHAFYQWQWILLTPVWQRLLILCSNVEGLLLEMIVVAVSGTNDVLSSKSLFSCLGDDTAEIGDGLSRLEKAGFIARLPHGRIVDPKCLEFLRKKRDESFRALDIRFIDLAFSKLICDGIATLSYHLIKKPNPTIAENLLFNRRNWVKHFENIWFGQDYKSFFAVKFSFFQLMHQANLTNEMKYWVVDLLSRSTAVNFESNTDSTLAWLVLASEAVNDVENIDKQIFVESIALCQHWLDKVNVSDKRSDLALFHQVINYLEAFYKTRNEFSKCAEIQASAFPMYMEHKAWIKAIQSLKSLAVYYSNLDELERAMDVERIILENIPYDEFPPAFYLQQIIDVLILRVKRKDIAHAQSLVDKARGIDIDKRLTDIIDSIQCDIDSLSGNYLAALTHYCRLWGRVVNTEHIEYIKSLQQQLIELAQHVGPELYDAVFAQEVPRGTISPLEYQLSPVS